MKRLSKGKRAYLLAHVRTWRPIRAWNVRVFATLSDGTRAELATAPTWLRVRR